MASLVVQTSFLGDAILTTPLIAELATRGPVDVVATPTGARVLANNPAIRHLIVYRKPRPGLGLGGLRRMWKRAHGRYDAGYLAQGSLRSALLAVAAGARERIGFDTSAGRLLYTHRVTYRDDLHHAERLWRLSMQECADPPMPDQIRPRVYPGDAERQTVDELLAGWRASDRGFVVLAPGSAWGTKRWPHFQELALLIATDRNVAIVGASDDAGIGDDIMSAMPPGTALNAAGRLGILASAELIRRAEAFVGNDSAPQHLASAVGTPAVTIFGPTVPDFGFGPIGPRATSAGLDGLRCRPCDHHGPRLCPLGHWRCMRELSASRVFTLLNQVLAEVTPV